MLTVFLDKEPIFVVLLTILFLFTKMVSIKPGEEFCVSFLDVPVKLEKPTCRSFAAILILLVQM